MSDQKLRQEPTLEDVYLLAKENNRMLHAMRRDAFVKGVLGFIWWVVILIVLPYFTWLYLQPYLNQLMDAYNQAQGTSDSINASLQGLPDFSKWFGGGS